MSAAIAAPIQKSFERNGARGPASAKPIAIPIAQKSTQYFASNATPAIAPAHQNERGSS